MNAVAQSTSGEASLPHPDDPRVGSVIGEKYRVERRLAEGGMGVIYAAVNTWTRRPVALKFPLARRGERGTLSGAAVERFLREAQAASRIEHPNVVAVLDLGRDRDGEVFLVQELLDGETLAQRLGREGPLSLPQARALLLPVMDALCEAHRQGVVHRDLKPENLFITRRPGREDTVKVLDFGVAWLDDADPDDRLTRAGGSVGTPAFMSPEQCRGVVDIDARSDVWAVALIWAEALSGHRVFDAPSGNEIIARVLTERVTLRVPHAPTALVAALQRGVALRREDRWPTLRAFADAVAVAVDSAPDRPMPSPPAPSRAVVRRAPIVVALTCFVFLLATVALSLTSQRPAPTHPALARAAPTGAAPTRPTPAWSPLAPVMSPPPRPSGAAPVLPFDASPALRAARPSPGSAHPRAPLPPSAPAVGVNRAPILEP